jgi:hypothetical protein
MVVISIEEDSTLVRFDEKVVISPMVNMITYRD